MNEDNARVILRALGVIEVGNSRDWLTARCPFAPFLHARHIDRRPSFAVHVNERGVSGYICQSCHQHGRISGLVRALQHFRDEDYGDLAWRADQADRDSTNLPDYELSPWEADEPRALSEAAWGDMYPHILESLEGADYCMGRGISGSTIKELNLRWDEEEGRVLFPVRGRDGALYGFTGRSVRNSETKVRDYAGLPKRRMILGAETWQKGRPLVLVEGLFAYAHLTELGIAIIAANVGALLGSILSEPKAEMVRDFNEPTYLLLDDDEGGDTGLWGPRLPGGQRKGGGAVDLLVSHVPLFVPVWPEGKDDPDQLTLEEVRDMLQCTPLT